jgi:hypothetical protein
LSSMQTGLCFRPIQTQATLIRATVTAWACDQRQYGNQLTGLPNGFMPFSKTVLGN